VTKALCKIADWKESLEYRLATAQHLVNEGLPDPHFDCLEAEVIEFQNACIRIGKRIANGT